MRPELNLGDIQVLHDPFSTHVTLLQTITLFKISYRHLIRCKSMGEYQEGPNIIHHTIDHIKYIVIQDIICHIISYMISSLGSLGLTNI